MQVCAIWDMEPVPTTRPCVHGHEKCTEAAVEKGASAKGVHALRAGSYFVLSMMDRLWKPELSEAEALELMHRGIDEVRSLPILRVWVEVRRVVGSSHANGH